MRCQIEILPVDGDDLATVVAFIASLNGDSAHHIGYFGTHPADITSTLQAISPPLNEGFRLAYDNGRLVGVLGVEVDIELGRAWLYGPVIDHSTADALADQLYAALLPAVPAGVQEHELFCDAHNQLCQAFAARHAFPLHGESAILYLTRDHLMSVPSIRVPELDEQYFEAFGALHSQLFPRTYASAQQILGKRTNHAKVFMETENGLLQGYIVAKADPDAGSGYTDYIGVPEGARRRGVGRRLLAAALGWMFSFPQVQRTDLTVTTTNSAALGLYEALGFRRERIMRAYRKAVSTP